jgi:hypothetical protein
MALSEADLQRARAAAAAAPPLSAELIARLRAVLAGCPPVQASSPGPADTASLTPARERKAS